VVLPYYLCCVEKHACLSHDVQVTGATWWVAMRIETGVGDLVQMTWDGQAQVRYSVARRSRSRVILCVVCTVHKEIRRANFLVWP
jgi:hypothetical protein